MLYEDLSVINIVVIVCSVLSLSLMLRIILCDFTIIIVISSSSLSTTSQLTSVRIHPPNYVLSYRDWLIFFRLAVHRVICDQLNFGLNPQNFILPRKCGKI